MDDFGGFITTYLLPLSLTGSKKGLKSHSYKSQSEKPCYIQ